MDSNTRGADINKFKMLCMCVLFIGVSLSAIASNSPTEITKEQGSIETPSELIWVGSYPNTSFVPSGCGTGLTPYSGFNQSGLIIDESGEIVHRVTGRSTAPDQSNAIHLGLGRNAFGSINYPKTFNPMHYGHINNATPITWVFINQQGDRLSYRSSTGPRSIGSGWFRCKVTQKERGLGRNVKEEKPSDVFFLSPDLQRIDSIEDALGIQFEHDGRLNPASDQLLYIGDGFVVAVDQNHTRPRSPVLYPPGGAPEVKSPARSLYEQTGFINTATGTPSTHRCGFVSKGNLFFDSRTVVITSNWDSESLYDPISDTVYFSAFEIIGLIDDARAIVRMNKGDRHYQVVDSQGQSMGMIDELILINFITQDGIISYSISDPTKRRSKRRQLAAIVVTKKDQDLMLRPVDVSKYDRVYASKNRKYYATKTSAEYALDHDESVKQYILNASLEVVLEFEAAEHPMHITRSEKVLTYSETSKQYTLYTPEGQVIKVIDVAQELGELLPTP